ncbi:hypothetical protein PS838_06173 [Pseudomonas fluorescens]|nr:hypothetical protein PS838_06173 [Pseudomonas fluorescens]
MRLTVLIEHGAVRQTTDIQHLHFSIGPGLGARARGKLGQQDAVSQFLYSRFGFFRGEETLFVFHFGVARRLRVVFGILRFVIGQNLFDPRFAQGQRIALISLLQAINQGLNLQLRDFLAQPFTETGTQAVGKIMSVVRGGFFIGVGAGKNHAEG